MTLSDLAAVATIVGGLAVTFTLIYVARQLRLAEKIPPARAILDTWFAAPARPVKAFGLSFANPVGMAGGYVRPPLLEMADAEKNDLRKELEMAGLPVRA